jgi:hypothetical protein
MGLTGLFAEQDAGQTRLAHVKVLNPLSSSGPPSPAHLILATAAGLVLRVTREIYRGALLQVRIDDCISLGKVRSCAAAGNDFLVNVQLVETFPGSGEDPRKPA